MLQNANHAWLLHVPGGVRAVGASSCAWQPSRGCAGDHARQDKLCMLLLFRFLFVIEALKFKEIMMCLS